MSLKHLTCEDRLRELELFSLKKEKAWGDLSHAYKNLIVGSKDNRARDFSVVLSDRLRGNGYPSKYKKSNLNIIKHFSCEGCQTWEEVAHRHYGIFHSWRYSKPDWTWPRVNCSGMAGQDDFQRALRSLAILWFFNNNTFVLSKNTIFHLYLSL